MARSLDNSRLLRRAQHAAETMAVREDRTRAPPPRVNDSEMLARVMPPTPTPPPRRAAADVVANGSGPSSAPAVECVTCQDQARTERRHQTAARSTVLCTNGCPRQGVSTH